MWKCLIVKREISFTKINDHFNFLPSTEDEVWETLINPKDYSPGYGNIDSKPIRASVT